MKYSILMGLIGLLLSCQPNQEIAEKVPMSLVGTVWQMDYSREVNGDSTISHVPEHWLRIKTFTKNRWSFTGYDFQGDSIAGMGGGTYQLDGKDYKEYIEFHHHAPFKGKVFKAELTYDSLYLYQRGQVDSLILEERWHRID